LQLLNSVWVGAELTIFELPAKQIIAGIHVR
jgi:hypothetical protein